jgi:Ser-tRNA(Ala) deacylase AlaX
MTGGQPADTGTISSPDGSSKFEVVHVQKPKGSSHIEHIGSYSSESHFREGDEVSVEIDSERRMLNARVHSAGHLLDSALYLLGMTDLEPSKGYHFPDGPYVGEFLLYH